MKHLWSWKTLETDIGKIVEGGEQLDILDKVIGRKWNNITKDELEVLFYEKELTIEQIAELFQVKESSVVHKLNKYNLNEQEKLLYKLDKKLNINVPILIELLELKFLVAPVGSRISVATQGRLRYETYITDIKQVGMDQWTWRLTYKVFCGKNIVSTVDSLMSWNYQSVEKILNQLTKMHFRTAKLSETLLLAIKAR